MSVGTAIPRNMQPARNVTNVTGDALVQRLFASIGEVSSLPDVALRIIKVANDPTTGTEDLLEAIECDPALAARILRTVNSSYFAPRQKAADLRRAITVLGFQEICNLALSAHIAKSFRETTGYGTYSRHGLWCHLTGVAAVARLIARTCGKADPQEAYLAGLLHDLGLILIDQYLNKPFRRVVDSLDEHVPLREVETKVLGFDHTKLGQFIASHWDLPEHVTAAARYHHASDQYDGPHEDLVHVVALADIFAHLKGRTSLGVRNAQMPSTRLFTRLKLREQQVKSIWNQLGQILTNSDVVAHFHVGSA